MMTTSKKQKIELILDIESLSHDGRGIAHIDNKTTFITGALPGEQALCQLTKRHSRYNEGVALEIISPSKNRVTPPCAHANICGGCSLQHMEVNAQVQFKQKTVLELLKHIGQVEPTIVLPPITTHSLHYRRKARLGVRYVRKKEKLLVGFREKSSNYLAEIDSCSILHKNVGTRITELSQLIRSLTQYEHIAQIEIAVSDTQTVLVFRNLTSLTEEDILRLQSFGKQFQLDIYLQPGSPDSIQKIWPEDNKYWMSYNLADYACEMRFYPLDFIQINADINPLMIKKAIELLDPQPTDSILDLFCGLGNFTLPIARHAAHVTGIEGSAEMIERAKENAMHNQINNIDFYAANLMDTSLETTWLRKKYDKIVLDPPRSGAKEIIQFFPKLSASRIVYISCNPATLARDAKILVHEQHYKLKTVAIINMFPHTSHIETIALFEK